MVALYVALIINGRRTFAQVPAKFKDAVKADLEALGLDENGNVDVAKAAPITFDPFNNAYIRLGEKVGDAFKAGMALKFL